MANISQIPNDTNFPIEWTVTILFSAIVAPIGKECKVKLVHSNDIFKNANGIDSLQDNSKTVKINLRQ